MNKIKILLLILITALSANAQKGFSFDMNKENSVPILYLIKNGDEFTMVRNKVAESKMEFFSLRYDSSRLTLYRFGGFKDILYFIVVPSDDNMQSGGSIDFDKAEIKTARRTSSGYYQPVNFYDLPNGFVFKIFYQFADQL